MQLVLAREAEMRLTVILGKGVVAHSGLPKADHGHMWRWHILPLMCLHAIESACDACNIAQLYQKNLARPEGITDADKVLLCRHTCILTQPLPTLKGIFLAQEVSQSLRTASSYAHSAFEPPMEWPVPKAPMLVIYLPNNLSSYLSERASARYLQFCLQDSSDHATSAGTDSHETKS